jgi:hypothetical protein
MNSGVHMSLCPLLVFLGVAGLGSWGLALYTWFFCWPWLSCDFLPYAIQ